MNAPERALDRVRKLLALAQSANPYEAAQAMGRAQELMSRYRLDAAQVLEPGQEIEPVESGVLFAVVGGQRTVTWQGRIALGLGGANGLQVYWGWTTHEGQYVRCLKAIGQPSVVRVAGYAFRYVVTEIERLARGQGGMGRVWANNFRLGAAEAVTKRVKEQAAQDVPTVVEGVEGLVPAGALAAVAREVDRLAKALGLRTHYTSSRYHRDARAAGERAGAAIEFTRGARGALT